MPFIYRNRLPILLSLIKFILPFALQDPMYELHRDEYLYLAQGLHPAWGFMEVPPLLSVFAMAARVMGGTFFWVKCWPSLIGAATVWVTCRLVSAMGGKGFAQCIAGLCLISGVYMRVHFLFQPNCLEIFWWALMAYFLVKYINTNNYGYLYLLAVATGLAWLSKYSVLFFIAGIIAALLVTPNRKLLLNRHLYLAGCLALAIALPNVVWQYNHRWPVVLHMKELRETQLAFVSPADFLKDQLLMHVPYFFIWIGGLAWLYFSSAGKPYRMLGWMYLTVIVLLIISSGKNYYTLGAYPMLLAAGGVWLEKSTGTLHWVRYAAVAFIILISLPMIPVALPVWKPDKLAAYYRKTGFDKIGLLKWEDQRQHPLPQDFADMLGWKEMADKVSRAYAFLPDSAKSNTLVYCRSYGEAGAVSYYGAGLPQVHSDNASFLFWMPDAYHVKNELFVGKKVPDRDDMVWQQSKRYRIIDSVRNPYAREYGAKIILFVDANNTANRLIEAGIGAKKDVFRR